MYKSSGFSISNVWGQDRFYNCTSYNSNCKCFASKVRYLTPCEILTEYLYNPCSIFCGTIVPIGGTGSIPPIPPTPPRPPFPPIINDGAVFESRSVLVSGDNFPFTTSLIEGNSVQHIDGTPEIFLAPNKTYSFTWVMETLVNVDPFTVGATLVLNGIDVPGSRNTTNIAAGGRAVTFAEGVFNTGPNPGELVLEFVSSMTVGAVLSTVALEIQVIG